MDAIEHLRDRRLPHSAHGVSSSLTSSLSIGEGDGVDDSECSSIMSESGMSVKYSAAGIIVHGIR